MASLANSKEITRLFQAGADIVMLEVSGLCQAPLCPFSLDDIEKIAASTHEQGKQIFVLADMTVTEDELDRVKKNMERLLSCKANRIVCYDFTFAILAAKAGMANQIIYAPNTLITHSRLANFYKKTGLAGMVVSESLSAAEILSVCKKSEGLEIGAVLSGHREIYRSRRHHVTAYIAHNRIQNPTPEFSSGYAVMEKQRQNSFYPLIENTNGTVIIDAGMSCPDWLTPELAEALTYGFISRRNIELTDYIEMLNKIKSTVLLQKAGDVS
ncbi:MAG TPA: U32 family peptidase [Bacillota bacterium]|nr:U32 family peptidase [Bacillota bacterium]